MSEGFKGFAWVFVIFGGLFFILGLFWSEQSYVFYGIVGIVTSIPLFIASGFCKILEDTRDTLKNIEEILNKSNDSKEENKPEN